MSIITAKVGQLFNEIHWKNTSFPIPTLIRCIWLNVYSLYTLLILIRNTSDYDIPGVVPRNHTLSYHSWMKVWFHFDTGYWRCVCLLTCHALPIEYMALRERVSSPNRRFYRNSFGDGWMLWCTTYYCNKNATASLQSIRISREYDIESKNDTKYGKGTTGI